MDFFPFIYCEWHNKFYTDIRILINVTTMFSRDNLKRFFVLFLPSYPKRHQLNPPIYISFIFFIHNRNESSILIFGNFLKVKCFKWAPVMYLKKFIMKNGTQNCTIQLISFWDNTHFLYLKNTEYPVSVPKLCQKFNWPDLPHSLPWHLLFYKLPRILGSPTLHHSAWLMNLFTHSNPLISCRGH